MAFAVGLTAALGLPSMAPAAPDELAGGSVVLELKGSQGLKLRPRTVNLTITGGALDPTTGAGTVETSGSFRAKRGGHKAKVKIKSLTFGANGGAGRVTAKIGKKKVKGFATLSGGTIGRNGFGGTITGATARLGAKGRQALAAGRGPVLGTVSVVTVPRTVEVLPEGTMTLASDPAFAQKLLAHCINAVPGMGGAEPIPPATEDLSGTFTFPITGGTVAPDLNDGNVITGGGQVVRKNVGLPAPYTCNQPPPVGTTVVQTEFQAQFAIKALASQTVLPTGPIGIGALGAIDLSAATVSVDPDAKKVTITGAPVTLDPLTAYVLSQVFPSQSADPNDEFAGGDPVGTLSLSVTTH